MPKIRISKHLTNGQTEMFEEDIGKNELESRTKYWEQQGYKVKEVTKNA